MKKCVFIFVFSILYAEILFPQAVDIQLTATDGSIMGISLHAGLDLTATDCIDPQLGEYEIPPCPPTGLFDIRFMLPESCGPLNGVLLDYRAPGNPPAFPFTGTVQHSLYWQRTAQGLPVDITYDLPPGVLMTITDQFGGIILYLGPFSGQGIAEIPGTFPLWQAYLYMIYTDIIPVELTSFTASFIDDRVQLNWTTATETNNSGFEIQRLQDYKIEKFKDLPDGEAGWKTIGFVQGFGTTTEPKSYSFTDNDVTTGTPACQPLVGKPAGRYKYRLKQIDLDGTFSYSNEIEVDVDFTPREFVLYQNYPNPFNPITKIKYSIPSVTLRPAERGNQAQSDIFTSLKVYDVIGNEVATLVNEEKNPGVYEVEFNASSLASGMYLYKLQAGRFVQTKKMILTK